MANLNTGSINGISDGLAPAHLKAGGGLNSAIRAVMQSHGEHEAPSSPMFDHKPIFQSAASRFNTGLDVVHTAMSEFDTWIGGLLHQDNVPGGA